MFHRTVSTLSRILKVMLSVTSVRVLLVQVTAATVPLKTATDLIFLLQNLMGLLLSSEINKPVHTICHTFCVIAFIPKYRFVFKKKFISRRLNWWCIIFLLHKVQ